ncbi:MAG: aminomethyl-transferring glycine dehydrogenase subunit GcvPA [Propioniciclava sp.]
MTSDGVHPYIPNMAPAAREAMLAAVGAQSVAEFYADVPEALRLNRPLDLPPALTAEVDLARHVTEILDRNQPLRPGRSFLGSGTYHHHVPAVVDEVIGRSEFLTAYAGEPYEDHGRFQALFEYASLMAELLAMDVVTIPTYDSFQAAATALSMAGRITGRRRVLVASDILPDRYSKVADFVRPNLDLVDVSRTDGIADLAALAATVDTSVAAIWVESPSHTGALEGGLAELARMAHAVDAILVVGTDPVIHGVITPPGELGADIVYGDLQSLGLYPYYGGAHAGFLAVQDDPTFIMELPSRIFGLASTEVPGEYGFGDVAYERTSFALREEGKEWVGTAAALWGIAAGVHLALLGPQGIAELGETLLARTAYAQRRLSALPGIALTDGATHIREFVLDTAGTGISPAELVARLRPAGIAPGIPLDSHRLLVCVTDVTTAADIDALTDALAAATEGGQV